MSVEDAIKEAVSKLSHDFFLLSPTPGEWEKHPTDTASVIDTKDKFILCSCFTSSDAEFIMYMHNNFGGIKRLNTAFLQYINEVNQKIENLQSHMISEGRQNSQDRKELRDLRERYTKAKGCIASLTAGDLILQADGNKLAEEILNETTTEGAQQRDTDYKLPVEERVDLGQSGSVEGNVGD